MKEWRRNLKTDSPEQSIQRWRDDIFADTPAGHLVQKVVDFFTVSHVHRPTSGSLRFSDGSSGSRALSTTLHWVVWKR